MSDLNVEQQQQQLVTDEAAVASWDSLREVSDYRTVQPNSHPVHYVHCIVTSGYHKTLTLLVDEVVS